MNQRTAGPNASINLNSPGIQRDDVILGKDVPRYGSKAGADIDHSQWQTSTPTLFHPELEVILNHPEPT